MRSVCKVLSICLISMIVLAHCASISQASEETWPQFRGPGGLGIAPDKETYPVKLDVSTNLLWKTEIPKGHSSPCIWGSSLFLTGRTGQYLETICLNRRTGALMWRKTVEPAVWEKVHTTNSHASATPVCDGERVYVYFSSYGLLAYDLQGELLWEKALPVPEMQHGSASSPLLAEELVIINCDQEQDPFLLAVDRSTGQQVWKSKRSVTKRMWSWSTPVLWQRGDESELVVLGPERLIAYSLMNGEERWCLANLPYETAGTPVYTDKTLYITATVAGSGDPVNPIDIPDFNDLLERFDQDSDNCLSKIEITEDIPMVYRVGEPSGILKMFSRMDADKNGAISRMEWQGMERYVEMETKNIKKTDALIAVRSGGQGDIGESHVKWRASEGIGQVTSPLVYGGRVYLVKHGGIVTCFDAETGHREYSERLGQRGLYFVSPVVAQGKIYFCSYLGTVFVVKAGDEFQLLARNKIGERISATPALLDGKVYLRTAKHMHAFGK